MVMGFALQAQQKYIELEPVVDVALWSRQMSGRCGMGSVIYVRLAKCYVCTILS